MSGGHFDYAQFKIEQIASAIDLIIEQNDDKTLNEWGYPYGKGYSDETISFLRKTSLMLRAAADLANEADYMLEEDTCEETFKIRASKILKDFKM